MTLRRRIRSLALSPLLVLPAAIIVDCEDCGLSFPVGGTDARPFEEGPDMAGSYGLADLAVKPPRPDLAGLTLDPAGWPGYDEEHHDLTGDPSLSGTTCTCPVHGCSCWDWGGSCAPHKERNSSSAEWCVGSYGPWVRPCY